MQSQGKLRRIFVVAPAVTVLVTATLVACRDVLSNDGARAEHDARVTVPAGISPMAVQARARLHERNAHDWIGRAHNQALDDLRLEIKRPGVAPSLCRYIADFATKADRLPKERKALAKGHDRSDSRSNLESELCAGRASDRSSARMVTTGTRRQTASYAMTPQGSQLVSDIETAVASASDSYDLAGRLQPVLDAAASLDTTERAAVEVAVSVAQSSVEYAETAIPAYQQLVENEYGACARSYRESGYSLADVEFLCSEGSGGVMESTNPFNIFGPRGHARARVANLNASRRCGTVGGGLKRIGSADVSGAVGGFFGGLATTRTLLGAGIGALGGGVGRSAAEFFKVGWEMLWCMM